MKAALVNDAMLMAIWKRKPERGPIFHSDRDNQYASDSYGKILTTHGIVASMSKKGDRWDNAIAESFSILSKLNWFIIMIFKIAQKPGQRYLNTSKFSTIASGYI